MAGIVFKLIIGRLSFKIKDAVCEYVAKEKNKTQKNEATNLYMTDICCNLRLDFCGKAEFFLRKEKRIDESKPEFTTEVIAEAFATANSINEIVAGAYR
ncbi:MAG: hypothetical protein ABR503_04355 [Chitinophagaceae bacterium]